MHWSSAIAADFIETAPIGEAVRQRVCFDNAARLLKIGGVQKQAKIA